MTANLVLHWHLDTLTPQNLAVDSSDNHLNGTVAGAPATVPDERFGSVVQFLGQTDELTLPDSPLLRLATYTVEAWVRVAQVTAATIAGKPPNDVRLLLGGDGTIEHRFSTTASPDDGHSVPAGQLTAGVWRHLAVTNDGHTAAILVDGTSISQYAFAGTRAVAQVPLHVGTVFSGSLAHLRIYDGALSDLEIQQDMAEDEAALAAFVRTHPLDFTLVDLDQQPVLFIDDSPGGQPMTLRIANTSRQDIQLDPLSGPLSADSHHFALHLRPGTLANPPEPQLTTPGWSVVRALDTATGGTVLFLGAAAPPALARASAIELDLAGMAGDGTGGTRGTRAELTYQKMRYAGEQDELTGTRIQFLELVNRRGRRDSPLAASFVGGNRVLNDGATPSTLRLRLANLSLDSELTLAGASFTVSFSVQLAGETHEWALVDTAHTAGVSLAVGTPGWTVTPEVLGQRIEWTLTPPAGTVFGPDDSIVATLSGVLALTSLGQAPIIVGYRHVPGFQDGTITLVAEKSPLLFADGNTGIGTPAPVAKLQIINTPQDANGNTLILGPVSGFESNLRLGYHQDYSWIQSHGVKPLALNMLGNNVGINTTAPPAQLTVSSETFHLQLRRESSAPAAPGGKLVFLELLQDTTPNPTYPSIRFQQANVFSHRIEARPEGLMFKTGDPTADTFSDVYAATAKVQILEVGGVPLNGPELAALLRMLPGPVPRNTGPSGAGG